MKITTLEQGIILKQTAAVVTHIRLAGLVVGILIVSLTSLILRYLALVVESVDESLEKQVYLVSIYEAKVMPRNLFCVLRHHLCLLRNRNQISL